MQIGAELRCFVCGRTVYFEFTETFHTLDVEIWVDNHRCEGGKTVSRDDPDLPKLAVSLQEPGLDFPGHN